MVDAAAAEKYLDDNPQFAKQYYDINFRPKVVSDLLDNNRKFNVDISKFHELSSVEESEILFDLIRDIQDNLQMEKSVFNLMRHLSFLMRADRMSLFMYRQRNGVAELATRLLKISLFLSLKSCIWYFPQLYNGSWRNAIIHNKSLYIIVCIIWKVYMIKWTAHIVISWSY